ncbi:23S rRNA (adenine(2030)-N(6))-methyltransferase RlmJ [Duganella sp. Leaf126]|uniref:23S rRNA (adenine(2030)-N(6))-methyltransferase RlmJ n=1 Tax=Duganella sp. Leaf126 TaxID=1736266 RepID=UPI001E385078|nr:23S rRNA (adenine(2030)-N(6))-methyltransferase RlmJ [Duganella sp. Leaf126]
MKHFVTIQLLQYLNQKETAYTYIDTHSGAGVYALDGAFASKNAEYDTGIGPLWELKDMPAPIREYVDLIKGLNPSGKMRQYPGSPFIADLVAREHDRLRLFELHPADFKLLTDNFRKLDEHAAQQGIRPTTRGKRVLVTKGDGFQSLKALLPPPSRRALVLIDPPYEDKQDYKKVKDALADSLVRFPGGTYAVWYPLLQRMESREFADKLKQLQCKDWLNVVLTTHTPMPDGFGLHSSGMFILNPPYTLEPMLKEVMPWLVKALGKDSGARFTLESGQPLPAGKSVRSGMPLARTGAGSASAEGGAGARAGAAARSDGKPWPGTGVGGRPGSRPGASTGAAGRASGRPGAKSDANPGAKPGAKTGVSGRPGGRPGASSSAPFNARSGSGSSAAPAAKPASARPALAQPAAKPRSKPVGK